MKKIIVGIVALLFFGLSLPAMAKPQSSYPQKLPSSVTASSEEYEVYIGAGSICQYEQRFGLGWHMTVMNNGDTNISGATSSKEMTLFGNVVDNWSQPFSLRPDVGFSIGSAVIDFHPLTLITLTVVVENETYTKSGYGIGPFVLLTA